MSLTEKLLSNSKLKSTRLLSKQDVFDSKVEIITPVPMLNTALSGQIDHGMRPGSLQIAGPSKHFKTLFGLLISACYMRDNPDAVMLFYDTEWGAARKYFGNFEIDPDRVIHNPVLDVEELKHDLVSQLHNIQRGDKVIVFIDSIGNLASRKETDDALDGKSVADMTRAKALKSLGRMVMPHLVQKEIPMISVNHTYKTLEIFSKDVVGGGTGMYYIANDIWIVGREQEKEGQEVSGYQFKIKIEKSRTVKEKSVIPIEVTFKEGINRWSGMFDLALEFGIIKKGDKQGWFVSDLFETDKSRRRKDISTDGKFWKKVLKETDFAARIEQKYKLSDEELLHFDDEQEVEDEDSVQEG